MDGLPIRNQVVLDVGSGLGGRAPYWLEQGAKFVYCIDVNRKELSEGQAILADKFPALVKHTQFVHPDDLEFTNHADIAILCDTFEHLVDPSQVLRQCYDWLRPGGLLWIGSIGWYHHKASHCSSHIPIPWSQVIFSQKAMTRTIQKVVRLPNYYPNHWEQIEGITRWDNVITLKDRPGEPLNMLSLRLVRRTLKDSGFQVSRFQVHPLRGGRGPIGWLLWLLARAPIFQELFHSYYTAILTKPVAS